VFGSSNFTHRGFPIRSIFQERNEGLPLLKSECVESDDVVALASDCIQNSHSVKSVYKYQCFRQTQKLVVKRV